MSPRGIKYRKVFEPPRIKGFKPYGGELYYEGEEVILLYEEYESIKLCDYDFNTHHQASEMMNVSRPTFTRIYSLARQKVAKAFVEGKKITIQGGKVYYDSNWYKCNNCNCYFNNPFKEQKITECPLCKKNNITQITEGDIKNYDNSLEKKDICICINCKFEKEHQFYKLCREENCPKCGGKSLEKK